MKDFTDFWEIKAAMKNQVVKRGRSHPWQLESLPPWCCLWWWKHDQSTGQQLARWRRDGDAGLPERCWSVDCRGKRDEVADDDRTSWTKMKLWSFEEKCHGAGRSFASVEGVAAPVCRGRTELMACNGCSTLLLVEERAAVTTSASTAIEKAQPQQQLRIAHAQTPSCDRYLKPPWSRRKMEVQRPTASAVLRLADVVACSAEGEEEGEVLVSWRWRT